MREELTFAMKERGTIAPGGSLRPWTTCQHPGQAWALPRQARYAGMSTAFAAKHPRLVRGQRCALPTASACHQVLKNSSLGQPGTAEQPPYRPRLGRSRTAGAAPPRPPGLRPLRTSGAWAPTWPTSKRQQRPSPQNNPQRVLNSKPIYHLIKHKKTACRRFLAFGRSVLRQEQHSAASLRREEP